MIDFLDIYVNIVYFFENHDFLDKHISSFEKHEILLHRVTLAFLPWKPQLLNSIYTENLSGLRREVTFLLT